MNWSVIGGKWWWCQSTTDIKHQHQWPLPAPAGGTRWPPRAARSRSPGQTRPGPPGRTPLPWWPSSAHPQVSTTCYLKQIWFASSSSVNFFCSGSYCGCCLLLLFIIQIIQSLITWWITNDITQTVGCESVHWISSEHSWLIVSVFAVLLVRVTMPARLLRLKMILKIDLKVACIVILFYWYSTGTLPQSFIFYGLGCHE